MVYLLAVGAAIANAMTSVLQRMGVEDAPESDTLRLRLIAHAVRNRVWLAGLGLMVLSFAMQATALHLGRLSEVQPILTAELLFLVVILGVWFQFSLGWKEWLGSAAAALGLAGFLLFADPGRGNGRPSAVDWTEVGIGCAVAVAAGTVLAQRGPRWWRAASFGWAGAVAYAFAAACTKEVSAFAARDWVAIFWHWQTYALAGSGAVAVFLAQNAYHAGPIAASQSSLVLVDPLASILIGIVLFNDDLRTRGAWGPLEALSLLVLFAGGVLLSHSPLITGVGSGDAAEGDRLRPRFRRRLTAAGPETASSFRPGS
ncbi:MAG TPA: DMT family transporter [Acidimicrobiales bacterium]|nr:DMT family transporter [Acidimicrobiales bacterium]